MDEASLPASNADLEDALLQGSVESRCRQAPIALIAMILTGVLCVLLMRWGLSIGAASAWILVSAALLVVRYRISIQARGAGSLSRDTLERMDRQFRCVSVVSQTVTGAGIWLALGTRDVIVAYMITLIICLYGMGTIINLAHDYCSVRVSLPLLMGQPALYWVTQGEEGVAIAAIIAGLTYMMISSAGSSQSQFKESIRIRFEKDDLVIRLEQEKRNALAALRAAEAAHKSKSFFMAAASHDLRQPVYAATISHQTLALQTLPPDATLLVDELGKALALASVLFDSILDLSKYESGSITPTLGAVHLADLLRALENEFRPQCTAKGLTLDVDSTAAVVRSDYDLLTRVIRNLLSNAVRYTARGGIAIRCAESAGHVLLSVQDTGIGISPEDRERIFTEFVQLNNPQRSRDRGVGLGLAIVRHITTLLNHEVKVDSELGKGTTISVKLPAIEGDGDGTTITGNVPVIGGDGARLRVAPTKPLLAVTDGFALPRSVPDVPRSNLALSGRTLWIVEDDEVVSSALQTYFNHLGCTVHVASSSAELRKLRHTTGWPDFAILDDMLNEAETGLDLAQWLAAHMKREHILLTTGSPSSVRWRELAQSGFAVLRKPVPPTELSSWMTAQQ